MCGCVMRGGADVVRADSGCTERLNMLLWTCGIRIIGIFLALLMGAIIVRKMKQWDDPALWWLLAGLSIGPIVLLAANIIYKF